jgi:glycosyltransferase involved in cell wall biosynthesis
MNKIMMKKLSIIVPVYNEEVTIQTVLLGLLNLSLRGKIEKEIILVDDCSTDRTTQKIAEFMSTHPADTIRLISHATNQGKGGAIHSALKIASGDFIVIQDSDLEYEPADFNVMIEALEKGQGNVIYGSRFFQGPGKTAYYHYWGNRALTSIFNVLTGLHLTDLHTCLKMFPRDLMKALPLQEKRFAFCPEITSRLARIRGVKIHEVPIRYYPRKYFEGKKIGPRDAFWAIWAMIKYRFAPLPRLEHLVPPIHQDP